MTDDECRNCGPHRPPVAAGLCLHCLESLLASYDALLAVLDTKSNLADPLVRIAWIHEVRARMEDITHRRGQKAAT